MANRLASLFCLFVVVVFLSLFPKEVVAQGECLLLGPLDAAKMAQEDNPKLKALRHRVEGQEALIGPAGTLPDPILGVGVVNIPTDTFSLDQEAMTQTQVRLTQRFPFPGKLSLRRSLQELRKEIEAWRLRATTLDVQRKAKSLWWELYRIEEVLSLIAKEEATLKKIIEFSSSKYETGSGLQSDVLLSQLELTRLLDKKIDLQARYRDAESRLLSLLGKKGGCIEIKKAGQPLILTRLGEMDVLLQRAMDANPVIKGKEALLRQKKVSHELEKKGYYPDFALSGAYGKRFGDNPDGSDRADFATLVFSLNIPIFYKKKQSLEVLSALEAIRSAEEALNGERLQVRGDIAGEYSTYQGLLDQERLYRETIIPKAETTLSALKKAYGAGKADILGLLRAELMLYRFKEAHINVLARANKVKARIEALVGEDL